MLPWSYFDLCLLLRSYVRLTICHSFPPVENSKLVDLSRSLRHSAGHVFSLLRPVVFRCPKLMSLDYPTPRGAEANITFRVIID